MSFGSPFSLHLGAGGHHDASHGINVDADPDIDWGAFDDTVSPLQMAADSLDQNDFMTIFDTDMYGRFDAMSIPLEATAAEALPPALRFPDPAAASAPGIPEHDNRPPNPDEQTAPPPEREAAAATRSPSSQSQASAVAAPSSATLVPTQAQNNATSTLTEFTKRKGWQAKVVEEIRDLVQIVDSEGRIKYSSTSLPVLTGWSPHEIESRMLKDMIHPDDVGVFVSEMSEAAASGNPLRMFYRFKKKADGYAILEVIGHAHIASAKFSTNLDDINQSAFCQAVFLMCREYPTKNSALLDSFLEHKMENERLKKRISDLRQEEEMADVDDSNRLWLHSQEAMSDIQSEITIGTSPTSNTAASANAVVPGLGPNQMSLPSGSVDANALNMALTREALEATAVNRPDSLHDKMARYENAASHAETIERLTGMRYFDPGDRARGLAGVAGGITAIRGDAGIAIPVDRDPRTGEKKKKLKASEEYVCTDCGVLDSPEWRKGPSGPKTLCNACGLRWAKREKKSRGGSNAGAGRNNASAEDSGMG